MSSDAYRRGYSRAAARAEDEMAECRERVEELEAALRVIAERKAPGSDDDDWAEVDYARAACVRLGIAFEARKT